MWCPHCRGEFREGIYRCPVCDMDLVEREPDPDYSTLVGPLTGRPIEEEPQTTGPTIAGTFVTMEEAQAAVRALSEARIPADVVHRDEQFPMTISKVEPGLAVAVGAPDLSRAQRILRNRGLLPVAIARFRREDDARRAMSILEAGGMKPRLSTLVLDDVPPEFKDDMDPYVLEVPADQEVDALNALEGTPLTVCENCGAQILFGDDACRGCGRVVSI